MGTFIGHLVPGLAFTLLGLWHTINTTRSYKLQTLACTRTWFPFPKIRHLELFLILSFSLLAVASLFFPGGGRHRPLGLSDLEHATMFLHLSIYAATALISDLSTNPEALSPLVAVLAASAFGQELFLLHFHSTDHAGLERHYHWLLQLIVTACFLAAVASVGMPTSFAVAAVRSAAVTCQGAWFAVMGFALWVPWLVPDGCYSTLAAGVECGSEEARARAAGLANLQFSWVVAGVLAVVVFANLVGDWKWMEYEKLKRCSCAVGDEEIKTRVITV